MLRQIIDFCWSTPLFFYYLKVMGILLPFGLIYAVLVVPHFGRGWFIFILSLLPAWISIYWYLGNAPE